MRDDSEIMVVDDDDDLRNVVCLILETNGFRTASFQSAREALERLRQGQRPDLILLDLMMPDMDGWQFREEQLEDPALAHIPVLVVTASRNFAKFPINASVLLKPFSSEQLILMVREALGGSSRHSGV